MIRGESQDEKHKDWIELQHASLASTSAAQTHMAAGTHDTMKRVERRSTTATATPAPPAGSPGGQHVVRVVKYIEKASPHLQEAAVTGQMFPEVVIELYRLDDRTRAPQVYRRWKLEKAIVSSVRPLNEGIKPVEEITLSYAELSEEILSPVSPKVAQPAAPKIKP